MVRSHTSLCLNVSDIPQGGLELQFTLDPSQLKMEEADLTLVSPISFRAGVIKVEREVVLKGQISTTLELACSRCLEVFSCPSTFSFTLAYHPWKENEDEMELEEQDLDTCYYMDDQINLLPAVLEHVILSVPLKPLCSSDCRGLCQRCGQNLNSGLCTCQPPETDERLLILKKLRPEFQKGKKRL